MTASLLNLTPHAINIILADGMEIEIRPQEVSARVDVKLEQVGHICAIPTYRAHYGEIKGLPEPRPGTCLIVSGVVRLALPDRFDLYSPGEPVRDAAGKVIGCRGLIQS